MVMVVKVAAVVVVIVVAAAAVAVAVAAAAAAVVSLKHFQYWSDWRRPFLVLSMKIVEGFLFQCLSPPGDRWHNILGIAPTGRVPSSSTLQVFREASHFWWLLCPAIHLLGPAFDSGVSRKPTGVFDGGDRTFLHANLGFPLD